MGVTLTNTDYPHYAVVSRTAISDEPPFTGVTTTLWEGDCDCQSGTEQGGTSFRREVFVSDYTIFTECIDVEIKAGDTISVTFVTGRTPVDMTIEHTTTDNVWEEDGKVFGTTIWAKASKA